MRLRLLPLLVAVLHLSCATRSSAPPPRTNTETVTPAQAPSGPAPDEGVAEPQRIDAETTIETKSGTSFKVSAGWFLSQREGYTLLEDPERELEVALLEVDAGSGEEAIAQGWKRFRPEFDRPVLQSMKPPARAPWEENIQNVYDVPAAEARSVVGVARRKGSTWYVALIDGTNAAFGRRGAQLNTVFGSLKPAGAKEESLAGRKPHELDAERTAQLEQFIEAWHPKANVPGLAVALVRDGKVIYEKGFGQRELGKKAPVTPETLFLIGSVSKSLTSLMMARLVEDGRFTWDTPVKTLMPAFKLGDPAATEKLTMRHSVCACTGLPRQDMEFIFEFANVTPEQRIAEMSTMTPTTGFGETFQYSNALVSTGGYVAARTAHKDAKLQPAFEKVMRERVFGPLGMAATTFDFQAAAKRARALPHGRDIALVSSSFPVANELTVRSVAPAGGAWSNVRDMARYVAMELSGGQGPDGKRYIGEATLFERRAVQTQVSDKAWYGLGLFIADDRGLKVYGHGGNTLGFTADMFFIPEANVGGVILTNAYAANAFTGAVRDRLMELWFDAEPRAERQIAFAVEQRREMSKKVLERVSRAPDAAWISQYVGSWTNEALGKIDVRAEGGAYVLDAGEWKGQIGQYKDIDGSSSLFVTTPPMTGLQFLIRDGNGSPVLALETGQQQYLFKQQEAKQAAGSR